jgi:hypothetical protein
LMVMSYGQSGLILVPRKLENTVHMLKWSQEKLAESIRN